MHKREHEVTITLKGDLEFLRLAEDLIKHLIFDLAEDIAAENAGERELPADWHRQLVS